MDVAPLDKLSKSVDGHVVCLYGENIKDQSLPSLCKKMQVSCLFRQISASSTNTVSSIQLSDEVKGLMPPYFALGFDQNVVAQPMSPKCVTMGDLRSLQHICKYGRPMYVILVHMQDVPHHA